MLWKIARKMHLKPQNFFFFQFVPHASENKPCLIFEATAEHFDQNQVGVSQQLNRKCVLFDYICSRLSSPVMHWSLFNMYLK